MGKQAKMKAARRVMRQQATGLVRAQHEAVMADPVYQAASAAVAADPEVQEIWRRAAPAQVARLRAAGWRQARDGTDGTGIWDLPRRQVRLVHSVARHADGHVWGHVSVSNRAGALPDWWNVRDAQWLLYPEDAGLIVIAPEVQHSSIAEVAHVWTKLTGGPAYPDFRLLGIV